MAEALVKLAAVDGLESCSAGVDPGECVNPHAVVAMKELGYDLSCHECKRLSVFKNETFDFVAKMDVADLGDAVKAKWIETWDVPDPAQGDLEHFREVRDMLAERVEELVEKYGDERETA